MNGELLVAGLLFLGSASLVILSGTYLAKYGDLLADMTGWGRLWVGTLLLATATSLPELVTVISAVRHMLPHSFDHFGAYAHHCVHAVGRLARALQRLRTARVDE